MNKYGNQATEITFLFGTFGDIAINEEVNGESSDFIRGKIVQIVKDPVKARKLTPPGGFNRRTVTANGCYETLNRDNVDVVDVLDTLQWRLHQPALSLQTVPSMI